MPEALRTSAAGLFQGNPPLVGASSSGYVSSDWECLHITLGTNSPPLLRILE